MKPEMEYQSLRAEITARVAVLHQLLALMTVLELLLGFAFFCFLNFNLQSISIVYTFLLTIPFFLAGLTFNYQANQMTLETLADYSNQLARNDVAHSTWDDFYGTTKRSYRMLSLLKIYPILVAHLTPLLLPLFTPDLLAANPTRTLWWFNLALSLLVLHNFRYKIRR